LPAIFANLKTKKTSNFYLLFQEIHDHLLGELEIFVTVVVGRRQKQQLTLRHDDEIGGITEKLCKN
jgi:hypothetical protein